MRDGEIYYQCARWHCHHWCCCGPSPYGATWCVVQSDACATRQLRCSLCTRQIQQQRVSIEMCEKCSESIPLVREKEHHYAPLQVLLG
jgi:hypothetical protein